MPHYRDSGFNYVANNLLMPTNTFELNCLCSHTHQLVYSIHRIFQSLSIRKKWQVRNDELGRSTSCNCCSVKRHHLDCCGKRIGEPVHRHGYAVPNEDAVDIRLSSNPGA